MAILKANVVGTITKISDVTEGTSKGSGKEWAKVSVTIVNDDEYSNVLTVDIFKSGEHVKYAKDFAKKFKVGDEVTADIEVSSKEITTKAGKQMNITTASTWRMSANEIPNADGGQVDSGVDTPDLEPVEEDLPF